MNANFNKKKNILSKLFKKKDENEEVSILDEDDDSKPQ